ncbi:MAG: Ig-like domain-containing protein [Gemmatimonadota bacterium]|nr:Ig-like domain-containing protein [Gemmatimonadota bacterium]
MRRVLIAVSALVFLGACGGGGGDGATSPTPPPASTGVATVAVALSATQITVGGTATATTELRSAAGAVVTGRAVSWTSSTPTVATVNDAGTVTALAAGAATITATSEGKTGSASLTVIPAPVATVQVTLAQPSLIVGTTTTASAVLRDERGATLTGRAVAWSSSTPGVATVDISGAITTLAVGSTVITATSEGKSATATLTVTPVPVATVTVALGATSIAVGGTTTATAVPRAANGATLSGRAVVWNSSNTGVATVSAAGAVTAVAVGTTVVTAVSEGQSGSATLTVIVPPVATVTVAGAATLTPGAVSGFTATLRDAAGAALSNRVVTWTSSDANVAAVSASGTVTAVAPGTVTITASSEGKSGSAALAVRYNIATVTLTGSSRLKVGDSYAYTATARLSDGTTVSRPVTWSIVETGRAAVTTTGFVTPLQSGSFTIRVVIDGEGWSGTYTAYDWDAFVGSSGTSFVTLLADEAITNFVGTIDRSELVVSCGTSGSFFLWVSTPHIITQNGNVAYSFDNGASIGATWRELSPDFKTLWYPGTNGSSKAFAGQIAASRRFGFAFGEYLVGTKVTSFRVTGMAPFVAPLFTQCPSNAIVAGAPSVGGDAGPLESTAARVMAEYEAARGLPTVRTVSPEAAARVVSGPGAGDRSELLRQWPVWTGARVETQQARRLR